MGLTLGGGPQRSANDRTPDALHLTSQLLKLNPEFYTVWNYRRQILQRTLFAPAPAPAPAPAASDPHSVAAHTTLLTQHLKDELQFLLPLLATHPKCYWLWNHRLWTLHQSTQLLAPPLSADFWHSELALVGMMLRRDPRNFHGWMYRRLVITHITHSLVESEFAYTTKLLQGAGGMSNYSAWHNRSTLIPRLLVERAAGPQERLDFLEDELALVHRNVATNPHDSALWFYHRWLVVSNAESAEDCVAPGMGSRVKVMMVRDEVEGLKELVEGGVEGRGILKALVGYVGLLQRLRRGVQGGDGGEEDDEEEDEDEEVDEEREREEVRGWLERLVVIDPMRAGRYRDLGRVELEVGV